MLLTYKKDLTYKKSLKKDPHFQSLTNISLPPIPLSLIPQGDQNASPPPLPPVYFAL